MTRRCFDEDRKKAAFNSQRQPVNQTTTADAPRESRTVTSIVENTTQRPYQSLAGLQTIVH